MAKQIVYDDTARQALLSGVSKLARAVRSTLGPRGRNAILDKGWGSPKVTKDGVTVAEDVELDDAFENLGAQLVKEAASKTNEVAGDGPTTATVLPVRTFGGDGVIQPSSNARSTIKSSMALIVTASPSMASTHDPSHGAGHRRPVHSGKLFVLCNRAIASRHFPR